MNGACDRGGGGGGEEGGGSKFISITESISKIFIPNFVCFPTNKSCKTYHTEFSYCYLGHVLVVGLGC